MILIKRIVPLFLAVVVVFVSAVPVFAVDYTPVFPFTNVFLEDITEVQGFPSSTATLSLLVDPWDMSDIVNGSEPLTFVIDGVSYSLYATLADGGMVFMNDLFGFVSTSPDSGWDFIMLDVRDSVSIEIYAGTKPADSTEATSLLLSDFSSVAGAVMQFVSTVADTIVSTPLLLLTVGFFFGGGCVGIFGRILSKN